MPLGAPKVPGWQEESVHHPRPTQTQPGALLEETDKLETGNHSPAPRPEPAPVGHWGHGWKGFARGSGF